MLVWQKCDCVKLRSLTQKEHIVKSIQYVATRICCDALCCSIQSAESTSDIFGLPLAETISTALMPLGIAIHKIRLTRYSPTLFPFLTLMLKTRHTTGKWNGASLKASWLLLSLAGMNAYAQLAAPSCGSAVVDFGSGPPATSALPSAMGTAPPASVSTALRTTTAAAAGWYSQGRDHTTGGTTGTGYFLALDSWNNQAPGVVTYQLPLTGLTVGASYTVSLWLTSLYHVNAPMVRAQLMDGATEVAGTTPTLTNVTDNNATILPWQQVSWTITAPASSLTLQVMEPNSHPALQGFDLGIDDISISASQACAPAAVATPVPANAPWALALGAALTALGAFWLRRRTVDRA